MNKLKIGTRGYLLPGCILLISLGVLIFQACRRTEVMSQKSTLTVDEAKEWWYGVYRKSAAYTEIDKSSVFAATDKGSNKKYPSWKRAVTYQLGNFEVVEAPLVYENKSVLMPGMGDIVNTEEGRRIFKASNSKVLLLKSPDGSINVRISTLVPSREYAKKKFYDLSDIHLNDIPEDFEGHQMIRKWNEEQINTYTLSAGKYKYKRKIKKLGKGNFTLTADHKLIPKESILPDLIAKMKPGTVKRSVGSQSVSGKLQSVPNTVAEWVHQCTSVWVPRVSEVCIIVHIADEPDERVCEEHESDTEGEYEEKCETVWIDDGDPEDPCQTYGINCPPVGENPQQPNDPPIDTLSNDLTDSCLYKMVEAAMDSGLNNAVTQFINSAFSTTNSYTLFFRQYSGSDTTDGYTSIGPVEDDLGYGITIKLNEAALDSASKEYVAATIFHEAVHAWIYFIYTDAPSEKAQHDRLATFWFNDMRNALMELCPSLSLQDATDLTWGGLHKSAAYLNLDHFTKQRIANTNYNYKKSKMTNVGTPCN